MSTGDTTSEHRERASHRLDGVSGEMMLDICMGTTNPKSSSRTIATRRTLFLTRGTSSAAMARIWARTRLHSFACCA
eukprot:scaffold140113_cov127-Phaeocystis_antarctica.AAC.1